MSYTKKTAAKLLGFNSVQKFNQAMVELGIFNKNKHPQPSYLRQKYFTFKNGQCTAKNSDRVIHYPITEVTERGMEFLQQTIKRKEGISC